MPVGADALGGDEEGLHVYLEEDGFEELDGGEDCVAVWGCERHSGCESKVRFGPLRWWLRAQEYAMMFRANLRYGWMCLKCVGS